MLVEGKLPVPVRGVLRVVHIQNDDLRRHIVAGDELVDEGVGHAVEFA